MINDMLDVYQEHAFGLPLITSSVCLNDLIPKVLQVFRLEAESRAITFNLHLPDARLTLDADRRRLERVLSNLVHNALKYSPSRGLITVSARIVSAETPVHNAGDAVGMSDRVAIVIEDEGPGIERAVLPHIFEVFFRPQGRQDWRSGRGLGLYFCRLVVDGHHGVIRATNRPHGGAAFLVELPLRKPSHAHHLAHC